MGDLTQILATYGAVGLVIFLIGILIYTDRYAPRRHQAFGAKLILSAWVWPLALVVGGVYALGYALIVGIPRVFRDAFPKEHS